MRRTRMVAVVSLALLAQGCTTVAPEWAESINPCCGQDLLEKGIEPPEDRCADIVVDQETARRLMMDMSGGAVAHWHVRLIPGGPACIWRVWPGRDAAVPENVQPDWLGTEPASEDSTGADDSGRTD